jgi:hypothetical protein
MRTAYPKACCNPAEFVKVAFPGTDGMVWSLSVERHTADAWTVFAAAMNRHRYYFRESAGGTYNCRQIAGTDDYSLHSYGLALDLNPSKNGPQGSPTCDQPDAFRQAVKGIHTVSGRRVFEWGGDWSPSSQDPMHWQIGATPDELATGIIDPEEDDMALTDEDLDRIAKAVWSHKIDPANTGDPQPARFFLQRAYLVVRQYLGGYSGKPAPAEPMLQRIDDNTRKK